MIWLIKRVFKLIKRWHNLYDYLINYRNGLLYNQAHCQASEEYNEYERRLEVLTNVIKAYRCIEKETTEEL